jgi:hypothetical protein
MKELRENVLKYGTIGVIFLLPLLYWSDRAFAHLTSKTFFFYGVVVWLFALWIYSASVDHTWRLERRQVYWLIPLWMYVAWMTVAGSMAYNPHLAFWSSLGRGTGLITLYSVTAFALIAASVFKKYGRVYLYQLMQWVVASGAILGITLWCGNEGFNLPYKFLIQSGGGGLMGNSSLAAAYFMFVLAFGGILLVEKTISQTKKWWIAAGLAIVLFSPIFFDLHGLLVGHGIWGSARGATLAIFVGIASVCVFWLLFSEKKLQKSIGIGMIVVGILAFGVLWGKLVDPSTKLHQQFAKAASGTRFIFWDTAQEAMNKHPWVGYGPENYMIAFQRHFNPKMLLSEFNNEAWSDRAHNVYYDTGVSAGYPGIVLYGALLISILFLVGRAVQSRSFSRAQGAILAALVIAYVFQNLFVFDSVVSLAHLGLLVAIAVMIQEEKKSKENFASITDSDIQITLAVVLALSAAIGWWYLAVRPSQKAVAYGTVLEMSLNKRPDHYKELLLGSRIGEDWDVSGFAHDEYKLYAKDPIAVKSNDQLRTYGEKDIMAFITYLEDVATRNPTDYRLYLKIVHLYATYIYLNDQPLDPALADHIMKTARYAQTLSPTDPEAQWGIAQIAIWQNDAKTALDAYRAGIAIDPTIASSHDVYLSLLKTIGDKKTYASALIEAKKDVLGYVEQQ